MMKLKGDVPRIYDEKQRISNSFSSTLMPFGYNTNDKSKFNKASLLAKTLHEPMYDAQATGVFNKVESVSPNRFLLNSSLDHAS